MLPLVIVRGRLGNHMIKFIQKSVAKVFCARVCGAKVSKLGLDSADEAIGRHFCLLLHNFKWWSRLTSNSVIYMMGHLCLELDPNILHDGRIVSRIHFG